MTHKAGHQWANRSIEAKLRCLVTERRGNTLVRCTENKRTEHVHQWRGKPFANQEAGHPDRDLGGRSSG